MDDDDENEGTGTPPLDLLKSYLAYVARALRGHRLLAGITTACVVVATFIAVAVWPRAYTCVTVLAAQDSRILDGDKSGGSLAGASEVILSRENVASIVDDLHLVKTWEASLPPISRFKQSVMRIIRGEVNESAKREALIATVQSSLFVQPPGWNESKLIITAEWSNAETAAALADAADQSFLRARHIAEISTITEYITILEGHANELREEIKSLAGQGNAEAKTPTAAPAVEPTPTPARAAAAAAPVARAAPAAKPVEDLTELRANLVEKQAQLKAMEDAKNRRLADAEQALTELRTKFTREHPMVVTAERNIANLNQDSTQLIALRAEVKQLSDTLKAKTAIQKEETAFRGGGRGVVPQAAGAMPGASTVEPLPADIMRLMQEGSEELDPAISAQFRTAVNKYATLRDKIGTARVDLDTAQAAFKHRYQIVIPAEPPSKPSKPKVPVLIAAGLAMSLVFGLLAAVLAELRTGKLVERWQVDRLGVPLLGDVRWPPASGG
jgi:uncharacterized protein involved in exopolysaccharide biosynthesis